MADASAGEPRGMRHGIGLYSAQTTQGTPVTPATGLGIATLSWDTIANPQYFEGPGSPDPVAMRPAGTIVEWTLDIEAVQTGIKTLLLKAMRTGGVVPWLTLGLGEIDDDSPANVAIDQIQDCKIDRLRLSLDASNGHAPLTGTISGIGTLVTRLTSGAAALLTSTPWMSQDGIFTRAGSAYDIRTWNVEIANMLSQDYVIHGSAPASNPRGPKYITEHQRTITGEITRYAESGVAMQAATLAEFAMVMTLTNPVDSVALALTYANVSFERERRQIGRDGIFFSTPYRARGLTAA